MDRPWETPSGWWFQTWVLFSIFHFIYGIYNPNPIDFHISMVFVSHIFRCFPVKTQLAKVQLSSLVWTHGAPGKLLPWWIHGRGNYIYIYYI
jgi:hypothetical protein